MIIYADLVFFVNFFGDFLCLWLVSAAEGRISLWRRIAAAAFGGIYGLLCTHPSLHIIGGISGKIAAAALMILIAYVPISGKSLFRGTAVLFMSSMLLSGGVELVGVNGSILRIMLAAFGTACLVTGGISLIRSRIYARYLPCELCFSGKKARFLGFYDSGNRLISGEGASAVIVGDERILKKLISPEATCKNLFEWADSDKVVTVPFTGAASGVMYGIILDYARIDSRRFDDVVLALSETELADRIVLHSTMV